MPDHQPTPRGPDRRQTAQRRDDAELHYAREGLLAAALAWFDDEGMAAYAALEDAVVLYRAAADREAGVLMDHAPSDIRTLTPYNQDGEP